MNMLHTTGKIIELTGVSGVGKSTWLKDRKDRNITIVPLNKNEKYFFVRTIIDTLFRLPFFCITDKSLTFLNIFWLLKCCIKLNEPFFMKINVFRNSLLKFLYRKDALNYLEKNQDQIIYIDEGISHIPFLLQNQKKSNLIIHEFFIRFKNILLEVDVFCLDVDIDAFSRLKARGHKRLKNKDDIDIYNFVAMNNATLDLIKGNSSVFSSFTLITEA